MTGIGRVPPDEIPVWPVELVLPRRAGFTLWGGNLDGDADIFLTGHDGRILLAGSLAELTRRLPAEGTGPLAELTRRLPAEGTGPLAEARAATAGRPLPGTGRPRTTTPPSADRIDFRRAAASLARGPDGAAADAGTIVDCLNAADDLARQLKDAGIIGRLRDARTPLCRLYSFLYGEGGPPDPDVAAAEFARVTTWFEQQLG